MLVYEVAGESGDTWRFGVELADYDGERYAYAWSVERDGSVLATGSDLRCGACSEDSPASLAKMMGTLFGFLSAWSESVEWSDRTGMESENGDLFPENLRPLLDEFSGDEFYLFGMEVRGDE